MLLKDYVDKLSNSCKFVILEKYREYLFEKIVLPEELNVLSNVFKVLSNDIRLKVLYLLMRHDLPVCLLATILNKDQTLISHHLRVLKECGLVKETTIGKFKYYAVNKAELQRILEALIKNLK